MSNIIEKMEESIGDTPYGKFIVEEFRKSFPKYYEDQAHEFVGVVAAFNRLHEGASKEAMDTPMEDKLKICKEALKVIKGNQI